MTWGLFQTADEDLHAFGDVAGLDVLDLACGTAYVAARIARRGARVVAIDLSEDQLRTARRCSESVGPEFPLIQGDADALPLASDSFDLVVSEHGAAAWADPRRWLHESARVLRPGGRLVFLTNSLLSALCVPAEGGVAADRLLRGSRDVETVRWPGGGVEHHLSPGAWINLLTSAGFTVDAMHELYAPPDATDHIYYVIVSAEWAARWPSEELWVARLRPSL